ncbi:MAG: hypothetical protein [Caudoviricetes sp.]|nr:MAG: hypothetical protein [Caudoviricetes sp.]
MLALLSPFFGIIGSLLPSVVRIFERKQEIQYEIQLTKIKLDAAERQADLNFDIEMVKGDALSRQSALDHDKSLDGGRIINAFRASVRPVITYTFFFVFIAVKVAAAHVMLTTGQSVPEMLKAVWDPETMALFSTIIAFWFGSRVMEKQERIPQAQVVVTTSKKK